MEYCELWNITGLTNKWTRTKTFLQIMERGVDIFQKVMPLHGNAAKLVLMVFMSKSNVMRY